MKKERKIKVTKDGPYIISGNLPIDKQIIGLGNENEPETWIQSNTLPTTESYALCRCGNSNYNPFCDGTHKTID
ncbi:CDGSH iron-sulfur domain-containing protein, partial [Candidatus Bathyarchaeota archaeon]|nr:CDGSH iron-sulfur domain-containing protein [Candidatus Bathyarchaeota archaeon]